MPTTDKPIWNTGLINNGKMEQVYEMAIVRHGRWMHDKDDELITGYCSKCGWTSIIYETDVADMPFCPNCGAKMDEEWNDAKVD